MIPGTRDGANLGAGRDVEFTVEGITALAWKKARMLHVRMEPDADERAFARQWLLIKLESMRARLRLARPVETLEVPVVAGVREYVLPASVFDVLGDAMLDVGGGELRLRQLGRDEYHMLTPRDATGAPSSYWPEKLSVIRVHLWPVPDVAGALRLQAARYQWAATSDANTPDAERYFAEYLVTALSYEIACAGGIETMYTMMLRKEADELMRQVAGSAAQRGHTRLVVRHRTGWAR